VVEVIQGRANAEATMREYQNRQSPPDAHEGWRYFLEKTEIKPGTGAAEATNLRQQELENSRMKFHLKILGIIYVSLGGLIAANSSTILTHLNWGASYLVHDFYRRFVKPDATERHYVFAGRFATVLLFVLSSGMVFLLDTAKDSFDLMLQVGAGTGLLYLVRWFWWRVTAWCEVVAMVSSFGVSLVLLVMKKNGAAIGNTQQLILTILVTTICWVATAYLGPKTDPAVLANFFAKTKSNDQNMGLALLGWVAGVMMIWSALFAVGNFLYGRYDYAAGLTAVFVVSGAAVIRIVSRLWR
jgi:Na+/proline symporter